VEVDPSDDRFVTAFSNEDASVVISSFDTLQGCRKFEQEGTKIMLVFGCHDFFEELVQEFFV
jgi:hypothetical protein